MHKAERKPMPHVGCSIDYTAYRNSSTSTMTVTVTVKDCGEARATVSRAKGGTSIPDSKIEFGLGGGVVTLDVKPDEEINVYCDSKTRKDFEVDVEVNDAGRPVLIADTDHDDIIKKLDLITKRLSTSSKTGLIWEKLSTAADQLRQEVGPNSRDLIHLMDENDKRISTLENVMQQVLAKLNTM